MGLHTSLSILIIGGIVGILVFAVSSAFTVWLHRNRSASEVQGKTASLPASLCKFAISVAVVMVIVYGFNATKPHTVLDQEGLLVGKDLFTVWSRAGFIAEYPPLEPKHTVTTVEEVEQGEVLVIFRRHPDPREIAMASQQRELLQEQLNIERMQRPSIDPTLPNQLQELERRLDSLNQREKELINQREHALREEAKNSPATHSDYRQIEQQLLAVDAERKQTAISLQHAGTEMRAASEMLARGLISQREQGSRVATYNVLQSKLDELRERSRLLEQEKAAIRAGLSQARQRSREQLASIDRWLTKVNAARQQTVAEHEDVSKRLQEESTHEHARHASRIRQLALQLAQVNALLASPESTSPIEVTVPWQGYVGYRDPSPASLRPNTGPLVVLYKPEHIWVELQVPLTVARRLTRDNTQIRLFTHRTPTTQVEFPGHLESQRLLPDEKKVALHISTAPPPALVRKMALGEEVQAQVHLSSTGYSVASLLEKVPASRLIRHISFSEAGIPFVPLMVLLCVCIITIMTLRHKRAMSKAIAVRNAKNDALMTTEGDRLENRTRSSSYPHTNGVKISDPQMGGKFIFDFMNISSDRQVTSLDTSHQAVAHPIEDMVVFQIQRIVEEYKKMNLAMRPFIASPQPSHMKDRPDYSFYDWRLLGAELNRDILTTDADTTLLATLHQYLEQQGIWVTPFIASTLSTNIHADMLLDYSLALCVKRLSAVQHKVELGQAMCDLARYLCLLQLFFPVLVRQIVPNLQQGLTMALRLATAEVEAETEADHLLTMLREVISALRSDRVDASCNAE